MWSVKLIGFCGILRQLDSDFPCRFSCSVMMKFIRSVDCEMIKIVHVVNGEVATTSIADARCCFARQDGLSF